MNAGGLDSNQRIVKSQKLVFGNAIICFIGGEQVRHHSFESKREVPAEAREERRKILWQHTLTAHTRVDFQVNGNRSDTQRARGFFEEVELPEIPYNGS